MLSNIRLPFILIVLVVSAVSIYYLSSDKSSKTELSQKVEDVAEDAGGLLNPVFQTPISIEYMRKQEYPGSNIVVEQELPSGSNYSRSIVSYKSEGLKIYALMTVPTGEKPATGWPAVIFNHGYIPPLEYRTTEKYVAYQDGFARNGYITFKSDYRGHGNSEGDALGGYGSPAYTIDVLNALASVKNYKDTDPKRIGMWGHSMGGYITLRSMVVRENIKAGVIWAGVVGSYSDLLNNWRRRSTTMPPVPTRATSWRTQFIEQFGDPEKNPKFWDSISANAFLKDVSGPIQIHHGTADTSVPVEFSRKLDQQMKDAGKTSELYVYEGDDHNIAANFNVAIQRSIDFFDKYVKGE